MPLKKKTKKRDSIDLVLDGCVYIVEHSKGKKTVSVIDGNLVLKLISYVLERAISAKISMYERSR